ncbi:MAG: molybdopterin converting factor subunit 1 [Blastocatellia bacterium]
MNEAGMDIHVLFFGACREAAGVDQHTLRLSAPASAATAWEALRREFPPLAAFETTVLFAINEEHARRAHALGAGDTLAVFPPVSGG